MSETNGTLQHAIEEAQGQLRLTVLRAQREAVEDYWDQFKTGADRFPQGRSADPPSKPSDRWYGRDWPRIRTIVDLDIYRSASRLVVTENGYAIGALQGVIDAVIGHGGTFDCDDPEVKAYLNDWSLCEWAGCGDMWDTTPIRESKERQFLRRLLRDGEVFLHADDEGAQFLDPERCRDYSDGIEGWSYGIQHQTTPYVNVNAVTAYSFVMEANEQLILPAEEVIHVLIEGTDSTVKRGRPFFSFDVLEAFLGANRVRAAVSLGSRVRAKIALLWKVPYGDQDDVEAMTLTTALRESRTPRSRRDGDSILPDGTEVYTPEGLEPAPLPADYTNTQLQAVQADLRCAGAAMQMPEYAISGDSSNANYASTRESGTPFVRRAEGLQTLVKSTALALAGKALRFAVANDLLSEEQVYSAKVDYKLPDVTVVEMDRKILAITTAVEKGLLTVAEGRVALGYSAKPGEVQ